MDHPSLTDFLLTVWDNVYGFDYSCIKDIALREPLVDSVDFKAVVTDPCMLKVSTHISLHFSNSFPSVHQHIDIRTAKKEDLTFTAPFTIKATRDDCPFTFCHCRQKAC